MSNKMYVDHGGCMLKMVDPACRVPRNIEFKRDSRNQLFLKQVDEEKRFIAELGEKQSYISQGNLRDERKEDVFKAAEILQKECVAANLRIKESRQLVASTEELRNLVRQVELAKSFKQLTEQKQAQQKAKEEGRLNTQKENEAIRMRYAKEDEEFLEKERQERLMKAEYRAFLKKQIEELEQSRMPNVEEIMAERERIQKVIDDFDKKEADKKCRDKELKKITKKELDKILENKKIMDLELRNEEKRLAKCREEFMASKDKQEIEREIRKIDKFKSDEEFKKTFAARLEKEMIAIEERRQILEDLLIREKKANDNKKYRQEIVDKRKQSLQLRFEIQQDLAMRHFQRQWEKEEEIARRRVELEENDRIMEEERRKQLHKKKENQKELREELFNAINYKNQAQSSLVSQKRDDEAARQKLENFRLNLIRMERLNVLKSQPKDVLKYLHHRAINAEEKQELGL